MSRKITVLTVSAMLLFASLLVLAGCKPREVLQTTHAVTQKTFYDSQPVQDVQVDDIDIAYKEFGEGDPLVLITGYSTTMDTWDPRFLEALATRCKVIVFDNRGMGTTTQGTAEFTIDRFADDTAGLIQALGYDQADVLGWSIGGDIALSLVVNHPERVNRLISYAGDCGGSQKIDAPAYKDTLKDLQAQNVDAPAQNVLAALFPGWYMEANPDYWQQFPWPGELSSLDSISRQNQAYETWDGVFDRLPQIVRPVLVATGTLDASTPPGNADILAARIPDNTLVKFAGAGHGLQYMYPYDFAYTILDFLGLPDSP